jgi:hypothetical protein
VHHPALVERVHGAELGFAIDAEVEADVGIPLRPANVQLLLGVAYRQQQRSAAGRYGDLRVDPERHHDFAFAVVQVAEVREEDVVRDRHLVAGLGQLMNECAAVGEALSIQNGNGLRLSGIILSGMILSGIIFVIIFSSIHGEPVQHCGKLPTLGMHGRQLRIGSIAHREVEADIALRRCWIVRVDRLRGGMIEVDGLGLPQRVFRGVELSGWLERRGRLPRQPDSRVHALVQCRDRQGREMIDALPLFPQDEDAETIDEIGREKLTDLGDLANPLQHALAKLGLGGDALHHRGEELRRDVSLLRRQGNGYRKRDSQRTHGDANSSKGDDLAGMEGWCGLRHVAQLRSLRRVVWSEQTTAYNAPPALRE